MSSAASGARYVLAVDVGGTFTDVIRHDTETGAVEIAKTASTPPDFIDGMLAGIEAVGAKPRDIKLIKIGTTIATNTVIMRTGARTALVTTAGFTDVLHAARAARPTLYDSDWDPAPALVDRRDTMTVAQRTTYEGEVLEPLDEAGLRETAARLRERGVEAVAVSFLHSYINDAHERRAQEILADEMPGSYVCRSSDILPEIREFERTSTTVANAYLGPVLERYLAALLARLEGIGYDGSVLITHSGGGVMSIEAARRIPARICQSGPAAGVMAGAAIGRLAERPDVIVLNVGGTSADVSLSRRGRPLIRPEWNIEFNIVISFPSVDVTAIGAGGGSIARIDEGGVLKVGPESAGARPGPACYGQGGTQPTATDANLVLGRLGAETRLAGRVALHPELAEQAIDRIAEPLGYSRAEAATGILRVMRANMAGAIRLVSVKRGHDPRDFALVAFGGAGPLYAVELARDLGIPEVIVPFRPGLGSAMGVLHVEVRHDFVQSIFATNERFDVGEINDAFARPRRAPAPASAGTALRPRTWCSAARSMCATMARSRAASRSRSRRARSTTTISGASSAPSTSATPRTIVIPCRRTLPSSKSSTPASRRRHASRPARRPRSARMARAIPLRAGAERCSTRPKAGWRRRSTSAPRSLPVSRFRAPPSSSNWTARPCSSPALRPGLTSVST